MGVEEGYDVIVPPTSREVLELIRQATDDHQRVIHLTLQLTLVAGVTPLFRKPLEVEFAPTHSRLDAENIIYVGDVEVGTLTVRIPRGLAAAQVPATSSLVRRDH